MMCALNLLSTIITTVFLLVEPWLSTTSAGAYLGMKAGKGELTTAIAFVQKFPQVGLDVLAFAACGALGQVFICE